MPEKQKGTRFATLVFGPYTCGFAKKLYVN
jgi:hypothetical protein